MGVGPLFPQQDVLLTRAQQENNAACKRLTQVCSEEGHILCLQKKARGSFGDQPKNGISELTRLWPNFAIALK